jgi:hypothetical protein
MILPRETPVVLCTDRCVAPAARSLRTVSTNFGSSIGYSSFGYNWLSKVFGFHLIDGALLETAALAFLCSSGCLYETEMAPYQSVRE